MYIPEDDLFLWHKVFFLGQPLVLDGVTAPLTNLLQQSHSSCQERQLAWLFSNWFSESNQYKLHPTIVATVQNNCHIAHIQKTLFTIPLIPSTKRF